MRSYLKHLCAAVGLSVASAVAPPALADHTHRAPTHVHQRTNATVGCMTIGNERYNIGASQDIRDQMVCAFQCAGYEAKRRGSSVYVEIGRCAPRVQFSGLKHRVSVSRRGNRLVLRPFRISSPRSRQLRRSYSYRWGGHRISGRRIGRSNVVEFRSSQGHCR